MLLALALYTKQAAKNMTIQWHFKNLTKAIDEIMANPVHIIISMSFKWIK